MGLVPDSGMLMAIKTVELPAKGEKGDKGLIEKVEQMVRYGDILGYMGREREKKERNMG